MADFADGGRDDRQPISSPEELSPGAKGLWDAVQANLKDQHQASFPKEIRQSIVDALGASMIRGQTAHQVIEDEAVDLTRYGADALPDGVTAAYDAGRVTFRNDSDRPLTIMGVRLDPGDTYETALAGDLVDFPVVGHVGVVHKGADESTAIPEPEDGWRNDGEGFHVRLPEDGTLVPYSGTDRDLLNAQVAPARRRGVNVEFLQGIHGRGMKRIIRVTDPEMPEKLREQDYRLPNGHTWRDGLVSLGLIPGVPKDAPLELPWNLIHQWRFEKIHLPALISALVSVENVSDVEYGTLLVLEAKPFGAPDDAWSEVARTADAVPPSQTQSTRLEWTTMGSNEYRARYQLGGGDGDLVSHGGRVILRTSDGFMHNHSESGSHTSVPGGGFVASPHVLAVPDEPD